MDPTSPNHNNNGNNNKTGGRNNKNNNKCRQFERLVRVTRSRPDEATEPVRIVTQAGVI
jgi:hypothetical protein